MSAILEPYALDRRFVAWALAWAAVSLVAFGVVSAIVPNPVFGRQIPPEPFAIAVWLLSAPLMGVIGATYTALPTGGATAAITPLAFADPGRVAADPGSDRATSRLGMVAGLGAFLAIGCPVCNKVALLALGASGAMSFWAPIQPFVGAASLALLAGTAAWRLRARRSGGACAA
jgi:hypothetical protein